MKRRHRTRSSTLAVAWISALLLTSAASLHAQVVYFWSGGDVVTGTITPTAIPGNTIGGTSTLNIQTTADHDMGGSAVTNNGTVNWSGTGRIRGGGANFTNNAAWNDSATSVVNQDYGAWTFVNSPGATYKKTAGTTDFQAPFNNAGIITVSGGTMNLAAGGNFVGGAVFGSSGTGVLQLTAGTLTINGSVTANTFTFNGGNLAGDHTFASTSIVTWQSGTWNSANTTTFASGATLNLLGGADHDLAAHTLVNNGVVNWTGAGGRIRLGGGGGVTNNATWNDSSTSDVNLDYGAGATFTNAAGGTYNKTSGITNFLAPLVNGGTLTVSGGTLNLTNGGNFTTGSVVGSSGAGLLQLTGGSLAMNGSITANNFVFNGGNLLGDQTFTSSSFLLWQNGTWNSANTTTLAPGATLSITGSFDHDLAAHTLINNGVVNWNGTGGRIRSGSGGSIVNNATWNDLSTAELNNDYGGATFVFINAAGATYQKSSGVTNFLIPLQNSGTVTVGGGTLNLANGGTLLAGSSIGSSGTGVAQLTGGILTATGTVNVPNFVLAGGQLTGTQTFNGIFSWAGANLNSTGVMTIGPAGIMNIDTGADHDFNGHDIVNNGIVNWNGGRLRSGTAATFLNNGMFNDSNAAGETNNDYGGALSSFTIGATGTYLKTAGTTTFNNGTLVNNGNLSVTGGTVNLVGGTLNSGAKIGSSGSGLVQLTSGILTATGTITAQNFLLTGGQLNGSQTFTGTLNWVGATFASPGATTVASGSTLTISSVADHDYPSRNLLNNGTVNWTGGRLRSGTAGTIVNNAQWNDTASSDFNNDYGGTTATFTNTATGIYSKSAAGTTNFLIPLANSGLIKVSAGILSLQGGFTNTNGSIALASGTVSSTTPITMGTGSLGGSGTVTATSITSAGPIFPGLPAAAGLLTINGNLSLLSTAQPTFELGGTTQSAQYDFIAVAGTLSVGGNLAVTFIGGFNTTVTGAMTFTLINSTTLIGAFANVANGTRLTTTDGFGSFVVNYGAGSPFPVNTVVLSNYLAVPEPSTWALLVTGGAFLALASRRRRR